VEATGSEETGRSTDFLLEVRDLVKHFSDRGTGFGRPSTAPVRAVDGVSFTVAKGESLGLLGESGCGKSTLGKTLIRYLQPTSGRIVFAGQDVTNLGQRGLHNMRRRMQIVFQDPFSSLNPRMPIREILLEPLRVHRQYDKRTADEKVADLLNLVGLNTEYAGRFPHQFSGGQRIAIARSLALETEMLILDEAVSALDVSIQAQIINLLRDIQTQLGLAYLFISHDLSVVRQLSDRVAVMYLGKIVEMGNAERVFDDPANPYTKALLAAIPVPDFSGAPRKRIILTGDLPNPRHPPSGCRFRTRCWAANDQCAEEEPPLRELDGPKHLVACHHAESLLERARDAPGSNLPSQKKDK
jgi:peptide/nickel transport system ATP-binding protein/oligopeptide transport system ATP-binding protein